MKKNKTDPKELNIPNICFSLTDSKHPREEEFKKQRLKRGFDDSETWSLYSTIINFIIPRLERFIKITDGMHENQEELTKNCKEFLWALKLKKKKFHIPDDKSKRYKKAIKLFPVIFEGLWW